MRTIVSTCCLAVILCGCARQEQQPPQQERRKAEVPSSPAVVDSRPVIAAFGDSLTAGVVAHTYPQYLQALLDQHGLQYRVENQGVAGDTTADGLARIDNVIALRPAFVLLEFGGNDGLRGLPVEGTKQNLETMIEKLKATGAAVSLLGITLPPNYGPEYIKPFTAMFGDLGKQYRVPVLPFLLLHVYAHNELMQPDGIHPNDEGNKVVARDVFEFLRPQLARP